MVSEGWDVPRLLSVAVGAAGLLAVGWLLAQPHPWTFETLRGLLIIGLVLLIGTVVVGIIAPSTLRPRLIIAPLLGIVVLIVGTALAREVHWHLSESDFQKVATGEVQPDCSRDDPCRVGWWEVTSVDVDDTLPTIWVDGGCYAGDGYALPDPALSDAEVLGEAEERYGVSGYVSVSDWRDGWVHICITT